MKTTQERLTAGTATIEDVMVEYSNLPKSGKYIFIAYYVEGQWEIYDTHIDNLTDEFINKFKKMDCIAYTRELTDDMIIKFASVNEYHGTYPDMTSSNIFPYVTPKTDYLDMDNFDTFEEFKKAVKNLR